jgi:hypothetical protein
MRQERGSSDPQDRLPYVRVEVGERFDCECRRDAGRLLKLGAESVVSQGLGCMPQSVWWMSITSRVPNRLCDTASERITSSVITPPALRSTCASPSRSPSAENTLRRESMHVTTASRRLGRTSRCRAGSDAAKARLLASSSSITSTRRTLATLPQGMT